MTNERSQPRPATRASEHSLPLVVRPTPCAHRLDIAAMRSAPRGLSPDDGASLERARPQAPRQAASRSKHREAACHASCCTPTPKQKPHYACVRRRLLTRRGPHRFAVPPRRRIMCSFVPAPPRRALKMAAPVGPFAPPGRGPLVGPVTARRTSHVPGPPRTSAVAEFD